MKESFPDLIAILAFIVVSFIYFFPVIIEDRILFQHSTVAGAGTGQEVKEYYEKTGERTRWTNALSGGVPIYRVSPSYDSTEPLTFIQKIHYPFLPNYVWLTFVMMFGFYILLRTFGIPAWLSGLGGIIWVFSSYLFIPITTRHIWKFVTFAYIPPTIADIVLAYRKRCPLGRIVTASFMTMQILLNHVQMTYYPPFVIPFMVGAFFEDAWHKKELPQFLKATDMLTIAGLIGVSTNLLSLYHTYEYSKKTIRGKSELKYKGVAAKQTSNGLSRDYITQWSYGIGETFLLLVLNIKGDASVPLSRSEKTTEKANSMHGSLYSRLTQYPGGQPITNGPVYVGAFVLMLFILGCFIVKGLMKWALLGATISSILLSWGKNFMGLTDFFIDYIPMHNKFRVILFILVIAEFTVPLLVTLTLGEILTRPELLRKKLKYIYISLGLIGGPALLFAIAPHLFFPTYIPASEMATLRNVLPASQLSPIAANLKEMYVYPSTSDVWRSFPIVTISTLLLLAYNIKELKATWTVAAAALLYLGDMWSINKRCLYDE